MKTHSIRAVTAPRRALLLGAGVALAMFAAAAVLIGPTFAQSATPSATTSGTPTTQSGTSTQTTQGTAQSRYQDFVSKLAKNLGISDTTKVDAAIKTTLKQVVDEQLAAGHISADEANRLKQAIDAGQVPFGLGFGPGGIRARAGPRGGDWQGPPSAPASGQQPGTAAPTAPVTGTPTV